MNFGESEAKVKTRAVNWAEKKMSIFLKETEKILFPCGDNYRFTQFSVFIENITAMLIMFIMLYITFLVIIYLITRNSYILTPFI